ncbi:FAD/NAD-P-binding domain-containing protein [Gymnopilus junonius]|uniref:FAD/NAD-P-binding domain-containing protein n=1 Tax=Gymnopilus junonius TaxID=109634 RepID=A0A9P5NTU4_GYMJU|nr:FAD/NAD-P-binding domain-containing protein [Gymnopilus junonius]
MTPHVLILDAITSQKNLWEGLRKAQELGQARWIPRRQITMKHKINSIAVVVGSGHAGSYAGCKKVLMIDKCPEDWFGGNGYFTAGAHRTVHAGLDDLLPLLEMPPSASEVERIDVAAYTAEDFAHDIQRLASGRADEQLVKALVQSSRETIKWLRERVGVNFTLSYNRQAYEVNGRIEFWGGMALSVKEGGKGLMESHARTLKEAGAEIWFEAKATGLIVNNGEVGGIVLERRGKNVRIKARSGFEASREMRTKYLGKEWVNARVRGTPYNTGDGFTLAQSVGAKMGGDWAGCHSTAWDANTRGLPELYLCKIWQGNFAAARGYAFQIWDAKVLDHLRKEEYDDGVVKKAWAQSIEELADKLAGAEWGLTDKRQLVETIQVFNDAVKSSPRPEWNPAIKDGRSTQSHEAKLTIPKSNWALTIEEAPFMAVKVACGITFTFGGLAIDPQTAGAIPGLFCTGEMVGGLFYGNYPGGSGLTAGAVFGRKAGKGAGERMGQ